MTKYEKRKRCVFCDDDFYNGHNDLGVEECWNLGSMKMIRRKRVPIHQRPPWTQKSQWYPSCYRRKGYVFVRPDQTR